MATQRKLDATKPFYAGVGAADLAVERLRGTAADVREQLRNADRDPKALTLQARNHLSEAMVLLGKAETLVETRATTLRAGLARTLEGRVEALSTRGRAVMAKLRDDAISGDVEIIDPDAVVVKEVPPAVEEAAAEAARQASAQQTTA